MNYVFCSLWIVALVLTPFTAQGAMTAAACKTKVIAAMRASGATVQDNSTNQILALCTGIIQEIQADAQVTAGIPVSTTGSPSAQTGATTAPGTIQ